MRLPTPTDPKKKKSPGLTASPETQARPATAPGVTGQSTGGTIRTGGMGNGYKLPETPRQTTPATTSPSSAPGVLGRYGGAPTAQKPSVGTGRTSGAGTASGASGKSGGSVEDRFFAATGLPRPGTSSGLLRDGQRNLTKAPFSEKGTEEKYGKPAEKPLSQIWAEYKDDPLVEEMAAEEARREEARTKSSNPEAMEAAGRALYDSIMNPDRATEAARQAEANAYDLARRGAGGAGTSYATMAGARAYQDAYADETARIKEETQAEQDRLTDAYMTVLENYNGTNGDSLRRLLRSQGFAEAEIRDMMTAAEEDFAETEKLAEEEEYELLRDSVFYELYEKAALGADADELRSIAKIYGIRETDTEGMLDALKGRMDAVAEQNAQLEAEEYREKYSALYHEIGDLIWGDDDTPYCISDEQIIAHAYTRAKQYGLSEADADEILQNLAGGNSSFASGGKSADGGETVSYNQQNVAEIYDILTQTNETGISYYTGYNRNTVESKLRNKGYSQEDIDEAIRMADEDFASAVLDTGAAMAEAIRTGRMDDMWQLVGVSEADWAERDEIKKAYAILDSMSDMVKYDNLDKNIFKNAMSDVITETALYAIDQVKARENDQEEHPIRGTWGVGYTPMQALKKIAYCVKVAQKYYEDGTISIGEYDDIMMQLSETVGETGVNEEGDFYWQGEFVSSWRNEHTPYSSAIAGKQQYRSMETEDAERLKSLYGWKSNTNKGGILSYAMKFALDANEKLKNNSSK